MAYPVRRRATRYPCIARVRVDDNREGITSDMSSAGLSFHTMDRFTLDEVIDLSVNFEIVQEPKIQVVHAAKVVWTAAAESGRAWRVGVQFIEH
jgi:Tfp pilus assembly protein PilZ